MFNVANRLNLKVQMMLIRVSLNVILMLISLLILPISALAQLALTGPSNPSESLVGQQVEFVAAINAPAGSSVLFEINGIAETAVNVTNNAARLPRAFSAGGAYTIKATLTSSPFSSQTITHQVNKAPASVLLTLLNAPSEGVVRAFTVKVVTTGAAPATGTVNLYDISAPDTPLQTVPNPVAINGGFTVNLTATIPAGNRRLYAVYSGDQAYATSVSYPFISSSVNDDVTADNFSFFDRADVQPITTITSAVATISGISVAIPIAISNGSYSIGCTGQFTTVAGTISPNTNVCVQHTSGCTANAQVISTLTVGSGANAKSGTFKSIVSANAIGTGNDCDKDGVPDSLEGQQTPPLNIAIKDNNIFDGTTASHTLFVKQVYRDFLTREADEAGAAGWVTLLNQGSLAKPQALRSFYVSPEYQGIVAPITRLYIATYLRIPDLDGLLFWSQQYRSGTALVDIGNAFAGSQEFINRYGNLTNEAFVGLLYTNILGRQASQGEIQAQALRLASITRGQLLTEFSDSLEYRNNPSASANVLTIALYNAMLKRMPTASEYSTNTALVGASGELALYQKIYNSEEYALRFLPTVPSACTGTVSFSPTAIAVAENVASGRAAFSATRTNTQQACKVDVVLCESGACGTDAVRGTDYAVTGTAFSSDVPGKATMNFAAGAATSSAELGIINNPANRAAPAKLKAFLRNASFGMEVRDDEATLSISDSNSNSQCPFGTQINGQCIPEPAPNPAGTGTSNGCFGGPPTNPCNSYEIAKPAACPGDIQQAYQYSARLPALDTTGPTTVDYGVQRLFTLRPSTSISFTFRTPVTFTPNGQQTGLSIDNSSLGASATKFMTLSETPCDFSLQKYSANDPCVMSEQQGGILMQLGGAPRAGYCQLKPDTFYYVNVRNEDAAESIRTGQRTSSCKNPGFGVCGIVTNGLGGFAGL